MKKDYENEAQDDHGSSSKLLSNLDENTSKELQETIQKNAALIQELKVIFICHCTAMIIKKFIYPIKEVLKLLMLFHYIQGCSKRTVDIHTTSSFF